MTKLDLEQITNDLKTSSETLENFKNNLNNINP